ncbi:MBL fold metallo-hydrolase [Paraflavitalea pollutisoli]|uniref:MBL fold metallo-hydrolase n=1 Tax=Paraflavitalea pollutisoli TaxID=3034143 RepID=UPI0023ED84DD|nr:MBL fold metallo-hydrolase [Paraflavitalea sp. H1-2-19X]
MIKIRLIRHATLQVVINDQKILVDPFLAPKDSYDPIIWTSNGLRNPMVDLPFGEDALRQLIQESDLVLVTHTHNDHWDVTAQQMIPKDQLIAGQVEDEAKFRQQGFTNVVAIKDQYSWQGITIHRTGGQHGTGEIGQKMAPVSGYVLQDGKSSVYIAGDTIWCPEVLQALEKHQPDIIVLNTGAARFDMGDPITMTAEDVVQVAQHTTSRNLICVHMDTVNHCYLKRPLLKDALKTANLLDRCQLPADGEWVKLT